MDELNTQDQDNSAPNKDLEPLEGVDNTQRDSESIGMVFAAPSDASYAPQRDETAEDEAHILDSYSLGEVNLGADNDMDIDAALASVATLSDALAEQEAAEAEELAREQAEIRAQDEARQRRENYYFPRPNNVTLHRGQLASLVPALLLIAGGAWLTFTLSTGETIPEAGVLLVAAMGSLGVMLLAYWLSSERWANGALFTGTSLLFSAGTIYYLSTSDGVNGWPLVIVAIGAAVLVSVLIGRMSNRLRGIFGGLLVAGSGLAGYIVTTGQLSTDLIDQISLLWPAVLVILLILFVLPMFARSRDS